MLRIVLPITSASGRLLRGAVAITGILPVAVANVLPVEVGV
jgi:hypothetical protein